MPLHKQVLILKSHGHLSTMNYCVKESSIVKLIEGVLTPFYFGFKSDSDEGLLHYPFDINLLLYLFE